MDLRFTLNELFNFEIVELITTYTQSVKATAPGTFDVWCLAGTNPALTSSQMNRLGTAESKQI